MSDLSLAQHTGLAFLLSQHNSEMSAQEAQKKEIVVVRNAEPTSKKGAKSTASKGEQAAPIHDKPAVFGVTMPERNTLDARAFLAAMLNAGKRRNDNGVLFTDSREVRNDQIKAIHAYCGFDNRRDFGSQETEARAKAQREIRGYKVTGPTREEMKAAARSATGFIAGLPDHQARHLRNLLGQETLEAEAMIQHEKDANDPSRSTADRLLSKGLAELQAEKLKHIRAAIAAVR